MEELLGCARVNEIMARMLSTLQEYEKETDNMVNAEIEVLQEALIARNELIDTLEDLKEELQSVVECESPEEQELLNALISGTFVKVELDEQHKRLQMLQRSMTVTKQRIVDKDKVISGQFKERRTDSRRELEQLKQTKQKIGYYNSAVVGRATGQSLNKNL